MIFIDRKGQSIDIDPLSQQSIAAAKTKAPGEGIGPAVASELLQQIADGAITRSAQLPAEYQHLGTVVGLAI